MGRPSAMTAEQIRLARDLLTRPDNTVSSIAPGCSASAAPPSTSTSPQLPAGVPPAAGLPSADGAAWPGGAPQGQGHNERPRHLDGGHQPLRQAQGGTALGFED